MKEDLPMKVVVTLFWAAVIGQVVGYIMTALAGAKDNVLGTLIVSLFFGLFIVLFNAIAISPDKKKV